MTRRSRSQSHSGAVALVVTGALVATLLTVQAETVPASAAPTQTPTADACDSYAPTTLETDWTLPNWSDTSGWTNPSAYRTITSGDIDGDGIGELIGRNSTTVEVFTWDSPLPPPVPNGSSTYTPGQEYNPEPGQWTQVFPVSSSAPVPDFSEADGWWDPSRYRTFSLADIDGQPGEELIARNSTGLEVRTWNAQMLTWNDPLPGGPPWTDAAGWNQNNPQFYESIITGDVNGDGRSEIVGSGPNGVETWGFDTGTGSLVRLDQSPGAIASSWSTTWDPSMYQTLQLADVNGDGSDEYLVRDAPGLRTFSFGDTGSGLGWNEPHPGSGGPFASYDPVTNTQWDQAIYYDSIGSADLDGDGAVDVFGRSTNGLVGYSFTGSSWKFIAGPGAMADWQGWNLDQYASTVQAAQVLPGDAVEVIGRGDSGVVVFYLAASPAGSARPFTWAQTDTVAGAYQDGASSATVAGAGFSVQPSTTQSYDINADMRYATIQPVTTTAGQPQKIIGRATNGIITSNIDGSSPSSPYAPYTNLQGLPTQFPTDGSAIDLSGLSPAGRAYWYLNASIGADDWQYTPDHTLLEQFTVSDSLLPDPTDLTPDSNGMVPKYEPNDPTQQPDNPGWTASSSALNVDRETYGRVSQDLANWTSNIDQLRSFIYGSSGLQQLVEQTFLANQSAVADIVKGFEAGDPRVQAVIADMIWGLIGSIGALAAGFTDGMSAAIINAIFGIVGAGAGALYGSLNPTASTDQTTDGLTNTITNTFCAANQFFDESYVQMAEDYGLMVSTARMAQIAQINGPPFADQMAQANQALKTWIWQQFANRTGGPGVQNFFVGMCAKGDDCPHWDQTSEGVWVSPENPNVSFRLIGQSGNGDKGNCSWSAQYEITHGDKGDDPQQQWVDAFGTANTAPAGPGFASPRSTQGENLHGWANANTDSIGILGWHLRTWNCD